jgi:molybdopterin molybdotransferase
MPGFERLTADWLPLDEAVARLLRSAAPLPSRATPLEEALGLVLARPVTAEVTLPPFDNSAMDGYAARSVDLDGASPRSPVRL